jgi:hypothetical protein
MRVFLLFILTFFTFECLAQKNISEVIREYREIETIGTDKKTMRIGAEITVFITSMEAKNWNNAHKVVKKLYRLDKTNRALHYTTIGYMSEMKNETEKALKIYKRTISRYNYFEWGYFNMGRIYYDRALEILSNAMEMPPQQYLIERTKSQEYFREAKPLFETAYQINKNIDCLHALKGIYYNLYMTREFDETERLIQEHKK